MNATCMQVDMHRVAAQSRKVDLDKFFEHEQHKYPVALSEYGQLRATTSKADTLTCLSMIQEPQYDKPAVDACVVDGHVIRSHRNLPKLTVTTVL